MATFVDDGIEYTAKLINGVSTTPFKDMALGSGFTAEAVDQTALVTELTLNGLARKEATCSYEATGKAVWFASYAVTADAQTVNEVGIFDSGDHMLMRHKYATTKTVNSGETLEVMVTFTETRAT